MVCSNCKANDSVTIEGKEYCLNCGQLIEQAPPKVTAPTSAPVTPIKVPLPASDHQAPPKRPAVLDLTISKHRLPRISKGHTASLATTDPRRLPARHMSDIKPTGSGVVAPPALVASGHSAYTATSSPAPSLPPKNPTVKPSEVTQKKPHNDHKPKLTLALHDGLKASRSMQDRLMTLSGGLLTSVPLAWLVAERLRTIADHTTTWSPSAVKELLWHRSVMLNFGNDQHFFWSMALIVLGVMMVGLSKVLSIGALSYGYSKEADHRPQHLIGWFGAGLSSLPRLLALYLESGAVLSVLSLGLAYGVHSLAQISLLHGTSLLAARFGGLVIGGLLVLAVLSWIMAASFVIAIGDQPLSIAWKQGSQITSRLGIMKITLMSLAELLFTILSYGLALGATIAATWAVSKASVFGQSYWVLFVVGFIAFVVAYQSSLSYVIGSALSLYRQTVAYYFSDHQGKLLSGRRLATPRLLVVFSIMVTSLGLSLATAYLATSHRSELSSWRDQGEAKIQQFLR